ncbi:MAG: hypothetical protein FRX49_11391 [Trebouxia sp. A1-2]|nr:MAG: hypothetical protein FRX49_11391 [Trebouxia sp. A1-2]
MAFKSKNANADDSIGRADSSSSRRRVGKLSTTGMRKKQLNFSSTACTTVQFRGSPSKIWQTRAATISSDMTPSCRFHKVLLALAPAHLLSLLYKGMVGSTYPLQKEVMPIQELAIPLQEVHGYGQHAPQDVCKPLHCKHRVQLRRADSPEVRQKADWGMVAQLSHLMQEGFKHIPSLRDSYNAGSPGVVDAIMEVINAAGIHNLLSRDVRARGAATVPLSSRPSLARKASLKILPFSFSLHPKESPELADTNARPLSLLQAAVQAVLQLRHIALLPLCHCLPEVVIAAEDGIFGIPHSPRWH